MRAMRSLILSVEALVRVVCGVPVVYAHVGDVVRPGCCVRIHHIPEN